MKRKKIFLLFLAAAVLLLTAGAGFAFGFDIGRVTNDQDRIIAELKRVSISEPIQMRQVARSQTGKMEMRVLTDYLEEFQKYADDLQKCQERLDALEKKPEDSVTVFEVSSILQDNARSYFNLKQMVENPKEFIRKQIESYGSEYTAWIDDWAEALEVTECRDIWNEKLTGLYENNFSRLKNK